MKTFNDLSFDTHPILKEMQEPGKNSPYLAQHYAGSKHAEMHFKNGYGVSVLLGSVFHSNGVDTYELAVVKNDGKKEKWPLCYDSGITEDVEGGISASEVTEFMERVQKLENR